MKIRVMLFAAAKQIAGTPSVDLVFDTCPTLAQVQAAVVRWCPELESVVARSVFAVDSEYAPMDQVIGDDCEVGLIPPVSGG